MPLLILALILSGYQLREGHTAATGGKSQRPVPPGFAYPESPNSVELRPTMRAKLLVGAVTDADGFPIADVLVERTGAEWRARLDAAFTNSEGVFRLRRAPTGTHLLKLSKPGYDTLLVRVLVTTRAKHRLKLRLSFST